MSSSSSSSSSSSAAGGPAGKKRKRTKAAALAGAPGGSSSSNAHTTSNSGADGDSGNSGTKGLRFFSLKVCQKVERKMKTNYKEVADELVEEYKKECEDTGTPISVTDQKNIRRRVYDALNVLRAMNVISKEKKNIAWLGLPGGYSSLKPWPTADGGKRGPAGGAQGDGDDDDDDDAGEDQEGGGDGGGGADDDEPSSSQPSSSSSSSSSAAVPVKGDLASHVSLSAMKARTERDAVEARVMAKRTLVNDITQQHIWYRSLVSRNGSQPELASSPNVQRVQLPFVLLNTAPTTSMSCQVSPDCSEYFFNFDAPFEIHDDNEVLRGLHQQQSVRALL